MKTCIINVDNEVTCKLTGLDANDKRNLVRMFEYFVPGAKYLPSVKLGRWDGKISFFSLGGVTYINLLSKVIPYLESKGYDIVLNDERSYQTFNEFDFGTISENSFENITWPDGHPLAGKPILLRDYQVEIVNNFLNNRQSVQVAATGSGKCQPYSSKVLTPSGWKTMGELKVGDSVVTPTGNVTVITNIYEPGMKDVYEITFEDGRKARSCGDHIWRVHNIGWRRSKTGSWRNISLHDVIKLKEKTKRTIGIPLITMDNDNLEKNLPIDPWLIGFLLGDGSFRNGSVMFSTSDDELVNRVKTIISDEYIVKHVSEYDYRIIFKDKDVKNINHSKLISSKDRDINGHIVNSNKESSHFYIKTLMDLNLYGKYSYEKFIPEIYFHGSRQQRLELIRGLVDSDGTVMKNCSVSFTSTSKQLAEDFQRLIRSVGGIARIKERNNNWFTYNGEKKLGRVSYTVFTRFREPWNLISLNRKKNDTKFSYQYGETLKLGISKIEKVSNEVVRCIMIDDPDHLYVTDDYIVTHNTIITASLSSVIEKLGRTIVIVPSKNLVTQTEADYRNMRLDVGVYFGDRKEFGHKHTITTWQSLWNIVKNSDKDNVVTIDEFIDGVVCVICDEAHSVNADVLKNMLSSVLAKIPMRYGLTGTIPKEEYAAVAITSCIGPVISKLTASELQDKGVLANCNIEILQFQDDINFSTYPEECKYLMNDTKRLKAISDYIKDISKTGNTLVLVDRINAGETIVSNIPNSVFVNGSVKLSERKEQYDEVSVSDDKIIVATFGVAAVGINIVRIHNLVLVEPGKSFVRVIQSIGRGLRKGFDKESVNIYDITSNCKFSKRHLTQRKAFYKESNYPFTLKKVSYKAY